MADQNTKTAKQECPNKDEIKGSSRKSVERGLDF